MKGERLDDNHPDIIHFMRQYEAGVYTGEEDPREIFAKEERYQRHKRKNFVQKVGRLRDTWLSRGTFAKGKLQTLSLSLSLSLWLIIF